MTTEQDILKRALSKDKRFGYLPEKDRHYTAPMDNDLRFAVIGTGIMGLEHIRITEMEGRARITAVWDPNPAGIAAAVQTVKLIDPSREVKIYKSIEEVASDPETDGLIICTPNYTHLDVLKKLASTGKHILMEKPMATTVHDAMEIRKIAEKYPAVFQLGLQYRFKAPYVEAYRDVMTQELLGDVKMINIAERRIPFLDKVGQWNKQSRYSGGTLVEKCCHYFDIFNLFAGSKPVRVTASGGQDVNFRDFEYDGVRSDILDNAFVIVDYENRVRACFNLCMFSPLFFEELVVCGEKGTLRTWEQEDFMSNDGLQTGYELFCGENGPSRKGSPQYPKMIESSGHSGATFYEHMYFVDNIRGAKTLTATAEEGFWSVVVGAAAEESVRTGKPVMVERMLKNAGIRL
ncbi:MAG TPA: gfo/Idh/MocA family oxidoreductase [Spirochaeta sp.]|nr:gfo/Idh/MocA family oxidoreductase [Spirochaeta sp.]